MFCIRNEASKTAKTIGITNSLLFEILIIKITIEGEWNGQRLDSNQTNAKEVTFAY